MGHDILGKPPVRDKKKGFHFLNVLGVLR